MSKEVEFSICEAVESSAMVYMVEIETMYGDADGWGKIEVGGFPPTEEGEKLLVDQLDTLERMGMAYPNGRGGGDDYNHVEGFDRWFNCDDILEDEWIAMPELLRELSTDWEYSPDGYGHQAGYEGYDIFFYDISGKKFKVDMIDNRKG